MILAPLILLGQVTTASIVGKYPLYVSSYNGSSTTTTPSGVLVLKSAANYSLTAVSGAKSATGKYTLGKSGAKFTSGPFAGGTGQFVKARRSYRIIVTTKDPRNPKRTLKMFGVRE